MEVNNRHLKPKPGGYFTVQSPLGKSLNASRKQHHHTPAPSSTETSKHENSVIDDGHSGTNSLSGGVRWAIKNKQNNDCDSLISRFIQQINFLFDPPHTLVNNNNNNNWMAVESRKSDLKPEVMSVS